MIFRDENKEAGTTLVELTLAAAIMAVLAMVVYSLTRMMESSNKKLAMKGVARDVVLRVRRVSEVALIGSNPDNFERRLFLNQPNSATATSYKYDQSVSDPAALLTLNVDKKLMTSHSLVRKHGTGSAVKYKTYMSICVPVTEFPLETITYADIINKYQYRPYITKMDEENYEMYCCPKNLPNCRATAPATHQLGKEDSQFLSLIVIYGDDVTDSTPLSTIPSKGEFKDVTGAGIFTYRPLKGATVRDDVDDKLVLYSYVYSGECFNYRVHLERINLPKDCGKYIKRKVQSKTYVMTMGMGMGVNELGSDIGM